MPEVERSLAGKTITAEDGLAIYEYEYVCRELTRALNELNPDSDSYRSEGHNVGWQNHHGETSVRLTDGDDLIRKLTPDTASGWNLKAELADDATALHITLSHHDSPTGETHVLTPAE